MNITEAPRLLLKDEIHTLQPRFLLHRPILFFVFFSLTGIEFIYVFRGVCQLTNPRPDSRIGQALDGTFADSNTEYKYTIIRKTLQIILY